MTLTQAQASAIIEMAAGFGLLDDADEIFAGMKNDGREDTDVREFAEAVGELLEAANAVLPQDERTTMTKAKLLEYID